MVEPNLLVTNKHVVAHELIDSVRITFPSAKGEDHGPFKPSIVLEDQTRDLAVLRVETRLKPIALASNYHFRRGQEVTVIGNPGGIMDENLLENAVCRGVMSTETTFRGLSYYQLGISVNPGNSGGPVIDSEAQVVGVITLRDPFKQGLGYCISVNEVHRLLIAFRR